MKKAWAVGVGLATIVAAGTGWAQLAQPAIGTQAAPSNKVLLPKAGGAAIAMPARLAGAKAASLAPQEKVALMTMMTAKQPKGFVSPPARSEYTVDLANMAPSGTWTHVQSPQHLINGLIALGPNGHMVHVGTPDGAWLVDCTLWLYPPNHVNVAANTAPIAVLTQSVRSNALVSSSTSSISPSNGHLTFATYFNSGAAHDTNAGTFNMIKISGAALYSCTLTPG